MMQQLEGEFAQYYNGKRSRRGAFWEDRFHTTLIGEGNSFLNCMVYIHLNMVRAGVVSHPSAWRWCGHGELVGERNRYRLIDRDGLSDLLGPELQHEFEPEYRAGIEANRGLERRKGLDFTFYTKQTRKAERVVHAPIQSLYPARLQHEFEPEYRAGIEAAIGKRKLQRESRWTESIAVGDEAFIERVKGRPFTGDTWKPARRLTACGSSAKRLRPMAVTETSGGLGRKNWSENQS